MPRRLPTFYWTHGGGPWPYMTGPFRRSFARLEAALRELPRQLGDSPRAILAVSGHWVAPDFAIMSSPRPGMVYDFSGFPEELYRIQYPAPGSPELARRIHGLVQAAGLDSHLDPQRGFDHGTYALLAVAFPQANIPVVQVSLRGDYDSEAHLRLGRALAPLREQGVLILGSGSSYHNLRAMLSAGPDPQVRSDSAEFDAWLQETLAVAPAERSRRLRDWERAPHARQVHPDEDHLLPLHVAVGAAEQEPAELVYSQADFFGGIHVSSYRFGGPD